MLIMLASRLALGCPTFALTNEAARDKRVAHLSHPINQGPSAVPGEVSVSEAVCCAMRRVVTLLRCAAVVSFTRSGATSLRAARERPESPILSLTPNLACARRLALAWGVHSVHTGDVSDVHQMTERACEVARDQGFAKAGEMIVAIAGMPFGTPGTTNLIRIASV